MKLNISYPATGLQKVVGVDDEKKLATLYDKRLSQEITGDFLGDEWTGYIFRITGGHDKQGFTMKQGVLADHRVRLLLKGGPCYRPRRSGERRRKSVRGCIISHDISALALVVVKKGEKDVAGLTDSTKPRRLGPKRASKIRKLFALSKKDDVRKYVIRREVSVKNADKRKKPKTKAPKIQRLVTPVSLQRKRHLRALRIAKMAKSKELASAYEKLVTKRRLLEQAKHRATKLASRLRSGAEKERSSKVAKAGEKDTAPKAAAKKEEPKAVAAPAPAAKAAAAPAKAADKKGEKKAAAPAPAAAAAAAPAAKGKDDKKGGDKKAAAAPAAAAPAAAPAKKAAPAPEKKADKPKEAAKPAATEKKADKPKKSGK